MSWASSEAVAVLSFLLPGLATVAVFHIFTSHPKPSEFERIVQALIYTILVQAIAELVLWVGRMFGRETLWTGATGIVVSVGIALVLGIYRRLLLEHRYAPRVRALYQADQGDLVFIGVVLRVPSQHRLLRRSPSPGPASSLWMA